MENPYQYNDVAFVDASTNLMADPGIDRLLNDLWNAGASVDDIRTEVENKIEEWISELEAGSLPHEGGGPKPKK